MHVSNSCVSRATQDSAASAPLGMDGGRLAGVPTPALDASSGDASASAKLRQRQDQRHQSLSAVLDETQELQVAEGKRCPHRRGGS
jgi:hypothetical protein